MDSEELSQDKILQTLIEADVVMQYTKPGPERRFFIRRLYRTSQDPEYFKLGEKEAVRMGLAALIRGKRDES